LVLEVDLILNIVKNHEWVVREPGNAPSKAEIADLDMAVLVD
jgi:hypothetical protein